MMDNDDSRARTDHTARHRTRRGSRRAGLAGLAGASALALGTLTAAPAWAHDELISSTPDSGEILTQAPDSIELEFSGDGLTSGEGITNEIRVTGPEGERWDGETSVDGSTMTTEVDDGLPAGQYEVRYRAVYSDGHQEEDTFTFAVEEGVGATSGSSAGSGDDGSTGPAEESSSGEATGEASADESASAAPDDEASSAGAGTSGDSGAVAGDDSAVAAQDQEAEDSSLPSWLPVAFGVGALAVVIVAVLLVRRKITQVDQWKRDSGRDSGSGDRG